MNIRQYFLPEFVLKLGPVAGGSAFDKFVEKAGIKEDADYFGLPAAYKAALVALFYSFLKPSIS